MSLAAAVDITTDLIGSAVLGELAASGAGFVRDHIDFSGGVTTVTGPGGKTKASSASSKISGATLSTDARFTVVSVAGSKG